MGAMKVRIHFAKVVLGLQSLLHSLTYMIAIATVLAPVELGGGVLNCQIISVLSTASLQC